MERLTMRNDRGMAFWRDLQSAGGGYRMTEDKKDQDRLDRLAAYEDAMPLERAQELAQAEQDGRLVVLPCKVGDMVYRVITTRDTAPIMTEIEIKSLAQAIELIGEIGKHKVVSWYMTLEEAEAALKKREEADNEAD